jgi:hypothetical protein
MRFLPIVLLCANACATAGSAKTPMAAFERGGYRLSGAEYWPWIGDKEPDYPSDVLWGFYPKQGVIEPGETDPNKETADPRAVACAEKSYGALTAFLATDPPALREVVTRGEAQGITPRFYLWTNDYTRAAEGVEARPAKLWYWKRKVPDPERPAGYWKWEATLGRDGVCRVPVEPQIGEAIAEKLKELDAPH